jgi:3-phenylpropionate/cinnamic acid dioxygenase small subunit
VNARSGIENTLYHYAWGYDNDEVDSMWQCYTTDVEVTFGDTGLKVGRDAVVEEMARRRSLYRPNGSLPWHVITNVYITDETATEASVKSFWTFFVKEAGGQPTFKSIGYYDDEFAVEDGVWRIKRRRVLGAGER